MKGRKQQLARSGTPIGSARIIFTFLATIAPLCAWGAITPSARTLTANRAVISGKEELPVAVATTEFSKDSYTCILPPGSLCEDQATYLAVYRGNASEWLVRKSFGGEFALWASSTWCPQVAESAIALASLKPGTKGMGGNDGPNYIGLDLDPKFNAAPPGNWRETLSEWTMATEDALMKCWTPDPAKPPARSAR